MNKHHYRLLAAIMLPLLLITLTSQKGSAQDASVSYQSDGISYQTFYDQLAPYGQWVNDPQYGSVWVPNVAPGFRPYGTDGHWVMTDQGNMWVSDQPWAWAAYHYGRWTYNPYYGWVWIPGYEWAPAWVNWRSGGGYYGWAPMGPGQVYGGYYEYPANYWIFVNPNYLYHPYVYNYYERGDMGMYVNRTEYVHYGSGGGDRYYGPRRDDIERQTGHPVEVYRISNAGSAGAGHVGGNVVNIYRPPVNQASAHTARPANVIEGSGHPIGKPEPISPNHESTPPAFRQEHQQPQPQREQPQPERGQPQQQRGQFQQQPQQQREQPQQQRQEPQQQREQPQPQRQQPQQQQRQPQQQKGQPKQKSQPKQQPERKER